MEEEDEMTILREQLEENKRLRTTARNMVSKEEACMSLINYAEKFSSIDPLIHSSLNIVTKTTESESKFTKQLDKEIVAFKNYVTNFKFATVAIIGNAVEGAQQLWSSLEAFLPKDNVKSFYKAFFKVETNKAMKETIATLFNMKIKLQYPALLYQAMCILQIGNADAVDVENYSLLWQDSGIKTAIEKGLPKLAERYTYYFDNMERIFNKHYIPNDQDKKIVSEVKPGVREMQINAAEFDYRFISLDRIDVNTQVKHISLFYLASTLLYIADITTDIGILVAYNQFKRITLNSEFKKMPIIMTFFGEDKFKERCKAGDLTCSFWTDCSNKADVDGAMQYLANTFAALHKDCKLHTSFVSSIDKSFCNYLIKCTKEINMSKMAIQGLDMLN